MKKVGRLMMVTWEDAVGNGRVDDTAKVGSKQQQSQGGRKAEAEGEETTCQRTTTMMMTTMIMATMTMTTTMMTTTTMATTTATATATTITQQSNSVQEGERGGRRWQRWMMDNDKNGNCYGGTALGVLRRRNA
jgi:hypothetical protein